MTELKEANHPTERAVTPSSLNTSEVELEMSKPEGAPDGGELEKKTTQPEYPPMNRVIPVVIGLLLTQTLVALVCSHTLTSHNTVLTAL